MASMAARVFFWRPGSMVRREVATGFFTGEEVCGVADAVVVADWACAGAVAIVLQAKSSARRNGFMVVSPC
jgi:hypothetical protein